MADTIKCEKCGEEAVNDKGIFKCLHCGTEKTENAEIKQTNKPWQFQPGQSGNPAGKPKGTLSIKARIKKILDANPERFAELCEYYLTEKAHRELLWKMIDGSPAQAIEISEIEKMQSSQEHVFEEDE